MLNSSQSIRDIAAAQPSAVALFERFDIDVCSLADKSLKEACSELQLSLDQVLEKLQEYGDRDNGEKPRDPATLSCTLLIQHIVRVHHQCVRRDLPSLVEQARKLNDKLGILCKIGRIRFIINIIQLKFLAYFDFLNA